MTFTCSGWVVVGQPIQTLDISGSSLSEPFPEKLTYLPYFYPLPPNPLDNQQLTINEMPQCLDKRWIKDSLEEER